MIFESLEIRDLLAGDLFSAWMADDAVDDNQSAQLLATMSAEITAFSMAEVESVAEGEDAPDLVAFAKALTTAGVKLYSAAWCSFCSAQKQLFQDGGSYIPFIEVTNPDRTLNAIGIANNITSFPTWEFPDQSREAGVLSLQDISERSGVAIPTSSLPYIKPLPDTTLLSGSPLHVALDGYDPNGGPLTYTVTSDNALVTPTLLQGNRSMRIEVAGYGDMVFQLFEQRAERPTERVIDLATAGFFDGLLFHRVIDGFVIQGGDPTGTGSGGSTLGTFDDQFHVDLQHNQAGILSYAKSSDDTNDSQFFVTLGATRHLDFNHSIFGLLVEGKSVLDAIGKTATGTGDRPIYDIRMTTVEIFQDTENAVMMLKANPAAIGQQANITVTVTDNTGNQVQDTFRVTVAADTVNGAPFLADLPDFQTTPGTPVQIQLTAIDVEGDPVYFDAFERGTVDYQLDVNNTTGLVTVTPPAGYVGPLEVLVGVRALNGSDTTDVWDSQIVKINVLAGELTLDLLAQSDSNIDNDNVTNVTNMTFRVGNTSSGALVQILHNGSVIGQGTATGSSIDITTNNLAALGDGTYSLTAVQTVAGVTGDPSNTLNVTLDTTPPVPLTSTPPTTASNGIEVVYDAQHPEEGTPGFGYSLSGAPAGAVIDPVTGVMRWTPTIDQGGVNLFQVVAKDLAGNLRTQDLSIDVTVVEQQVLIELVVIDSQENPITTISAGEDFWVFAYIQDIRTPAEGVFAAYADIFFDSTIVSSQASSLTDVIFGTKYQNGKSGFFATPGLIDEIGAFGPITPVGGGKELLFAIPFRADQAGQVTFRLDPSDMIGREVLVFGQNEPVEWNAITMANATLTVSSGLVAVNDLFNVDEDSVNFPLNVLANDVNEIGGTVTISQVGATSHGGVVTIGTNGQNLLYSPAANFFGEETFTYTITAGGLTSSASVTVQVAPVNDPPTAVNDTFTVDTDSQNNFLDVLANDLITPDVNETLRIVSVGSTSHGGTVVIAPNGTHLLYTPPVGFSGNETFNYTIRDRAAGDPTGLQSTASVMMTVESVARPTARPDTATVQEDSTANSVLVLANDEPVVSGATLRVVSVTQSKFGGTVTIAAGGTHVLYTPAPDFFGEDTFTYTVEEVDGERSTASVTMTVLNVNDPPTANDDTYQVSKGSATKTLNVLENDTIFPDVGETLTIVAVTQGSQGGTVTIAAGGQTVLYTPSANASLPDTYTETFTYTISDGSDETDTATVTIQIRPYTARDIGGIVMYSASTLGIGGLAVNLQGFDNFNGPVAATSQTMGDGTYKFTDLAPGSYQLQTNSAPFLLQSNTVLTVQSGDEDGSSLSNNFNSITRNPATLSIMDFLARAPRQSSISPTNSVMIAAQAGGQQDWYSYQAGWQDYTQLQSQLSSDASQLTLTALHSSGQQYQGTVSLNGSSFVKRLANSGGAHLIRIDASAAQLGLQPVATAPLVTVTPKVTNSTTPTITGTVSSGALQVAVNNRTYSAGDGNLTVTGTNWTLAIPAAHALPQGTYNVSATATDSAGRVGSDTTSNELVVDTTPPTVTVNALTTASTTPTITGSVSDGALQVAVNNRTYTVGGGNLTVTGTTWTLAIPAAHALAAGTYNVTATSTDAAGNVGSDTTSNELVVDFTVPVVTVNPLTTNSNTPTVTGTVSNGTLQVAVNGRTYTAGDGALSVSGTVWTLQIPAAHGLVDGTYNVSASATNAAGSVGSDATANELVVDTVAPTVTVNPAITADTTPTITGTVSDGALQVTVNNRTYTAGDGNLSVTGSAWSLTIPAAHAMAEGTYNVTASATDAAGNVGTDTSVNELVIDTSLPLVTVNPSFTNDTTPTVTGTVSEGTLQVTVDGQTYTVGDGNLTVSGTNWTLQIPAANALPEGTYNVSATATNLAGNSGSDNTINELVIDTTPPVVTVNPLSTTDTTPVITGTVSDGILQVTVNGQTYTVGDGNLSVTGNAWTLQIPAANVLPQGTYNVAAQAVDLAGNVGTDATSDELVVDTELPVVTVNPLVTNDTTPAITGTTSEPTMQVIVNGDVYTTGDGRLAVSGSTWTLQIPAVHALAEGTYAVSASATDSAGNVGSDGTTDELVIDTTPPALTVNPLITNDTTPTITGTVSDGTLQVTVNGQTYQPGDGHLTVTDINWTLQIPAADALAEGVYSVTATATDAAGNIGTDETLDEIVIDTTPPTVTVDALTTAVATPVIAGSVSDGVLQVIVNGQTYSAGDGRLSVDDDRWTLEIPADHALADGTYSVTASAVDAAGNTGSDQTNNELIVDSNLPLVTVDLLVTNDTTPAITGTVSDGTLQVIVNGQTYTAGDGHLTVTGTDWTLQIPEEHALTEGIYAVAASAANTEGNVGSDATIDELVIDTTPPGVTVATLLTSDTTPVLAGTVSDGTLQVVVNGQTYTAGDGDLTVTGTDWTLQIPQEHLLADGTYTVTATATDSAGNVGTDATSDELVVDTTPPALTVNALVTNDTTPLVTGTVSDGALQVTVDGQTYTAGDGHLAVSGTDWSLQIPAEHALDEGTYTVTTSAIDAAGNVGSDQTADELVIDTTPPAVTVNTLATTDVTPTISGTLSDGTLEVIVNSQTYTVGDGHLSVTGTDWVLQIPAEHALAVGTFTVTASATDLAGNAGSDPGTGQLVIQAEEEQGEGEAFEILWATDDLLDEVGQLVPAVSANAYAQAVDTLLAEQVA